MPAWNLFGAKKPAQYHNPNTEDPAAQQQHQQHTTTHGHSPRPHKLFRSLSDDSLITSSSAGSSVNPARIQAVSTQSSAMDIFKSVSAANAAEAALSHSASAKLALPPQLVSKHHDLVVFFFFCVGLNTNI